MQLGSLQYVILHTPFTNAHPLGNEERGEGGEAGRGRDAAKVESGPQWPKDVVIYIESFWSQNYRSGVRLLQNTKGDKQKENRE